MYKIIIISILCAVHKNVLASDDLTPEQKEMLGNLHKACVGETGVSEDLISAAAKGNFAEDKNLKCYMKCLMTSIGVMEEDGTFDFEAYIDLLPESMQEMGKKVVENCQEAVPQQRNASSYSKPVGDACETAFKINKCNYEVTPDKYMLF